MLDSIRRVAAIALVMAAPSLAQWLNYPTAGVPKTSSGKPTIVLNTEFLDYYGVENEKDIAHLVGK